MNTASTNHWKYLARRPGSTYRQLFVKGTKLAAWQLYCDTVDGETEPGRSPEEVADDYGLPLAAVQEAIAYSKSDPPELRQDFAYDDAIAEASGENDPNYKWNPSMRKLLAPQEKAEIQRRIYGE